jgi:hypothetical protein
VPWGKGSQKIYIGKVRRRGGRGARGEFENVEIWEFENLKMWEFGIMEIWKFGNLGI